MNTFYKSSILKKLAHSLIVTLSLGFSCQQPVAHHKPSDAQSSKEQVPSTIKFTSPEQNQALKLGTNLTLQVQVTNTLTSLDSIQFLIDDARIGAIKQANETFIWATAHAKAGIHHISAVACETSGAKSQTNISVKLLPEPAKGYTYKIVCTYPHDKSAYTQGLLFDNGYLFESTGQYGASTLRKVRLQSGESIKTHQLPNDIFGEGLAASDNRLVQLSWREQVAFIYDKNTFQLINKLTYPIKEGWGLTYDGEHLVMSDGSAYLYFLNKESLTEEHRIEVYDENGPVAQLNELEYVNGEIWANKYTTDYIMRINPGNGAIIGKIDLTGLLKPNDRLPDTNVLNGIAFDPLTKRIWVTGKNWPKLFQIAIEQ